MASVRAARRATACSPSSPPAAGLPATSAGPRACSSRRAPAYHPTTARREGKGKERERSRVSGTSLGRTPRPVLGGVPAQPRPRDLGLRLPAGAGPAVPAAVRLLPRGARVAPGGPYRRHPPPNRAWVAQQLREATPCGQRPRYLLRDNDRKYGQAFARVAEARGIAALRTAYRTPKENAARERFLGRVRRDCLDHVLVLGEAHLRRMLREYLAYFNAERQHQGLQQRIPDGVRPLTSTGDRGQSTCRSGAGRVTPRIRESGLSQGGGLTDEPTSHYRTSIRQARFPTPARSRGSSLPVRQCLYAVLVRFRRHA